MTRKPTFPSIHYAIFLAQNVNIAASRVLDS
ncbi:hypothetical protein BN406_03983 (plasmid) [Sinorhizobium meliloti Rm41]|nr:hypothetical protein BN406_03983 [Sinorhizobium meliloti Rm41]